MQLTRTIQLYEMNKKQFFTDVSLPRLTFKAFVYVWKMKKQQSEFYMVATKSHAFNILIIESALNKAYS